MSTIFWKALKFSSALLGAALLFSGSAYARESSLDQKVASSTEATVAPTTELSPAQAVASNSATTQSASELTAATSANPLAAHKESATAALTEQPQNSVSQLTDSDASANVNNADSPLAQQVPTVDNGTSNTSDVLEQVQEYQDGGNDATTIDQVTNVTQLSDVRPTDWAYEALRSLVERYGCIAGYPDGTYRGNRALTRYEFAAGLNACLQQIERLITERSTGFVTKADLETLQRLVDEFRSELTALGTRVDKLEGRVAFLEDRQFSITTKLRGEVIFNVADLFGEETGVQQAGNTRFIAPLPPGADYQNDETVFSYRARLNFDTSFTGEDLLRVRLQAANITQFGPLTGSLASPASPLGTNLTREGRFAFQADTGSDVVIDDLFYRFPVGDIAQVYLWANGAGYEDSVEVLNPAFESSGTGALSRFGRFSPIYRMGGQDAGVVLTIGPKSPLRIDVGYLTDEGNNPAEGAGLFDGNYSALAQVTFQPLRQLRLAATYVHNYDSSNLRHGTGSIASQVFTGGNPVVGNSYGVEASFAFTPQLIISGWGMYTNATVLGVGNADIWSYGGTLAITDFGTKGSALGFVVGMEPRLTGADSTLAGGLPNGIAGLDLGARQDRDVSLHLEGFYKFRLSPNILITPGVIWLTSPGHDNRNDDIVIGTIRTTFTF